MTVGENCEPFDIERAQPWSRRYNIEFRWVPRDLFLKHGYYATATERYTYRFQEPLVMLLDVDLVLSRNMDDLLDLVAVEPAIYALTAHASPWQKSDLLHVRSDQEWWREVFELAGLADPPFVSEYLGYGVFFEGEGVPRHCPPYFNQGVVLAPAGIMEKLGQTMYREMEAANCAAETFYRVQVALTLAIQRHGVPWRALPLRYNFAPVMQQYLTVMPEEWPEVRTIHYSNFTPWFKTDLLMGNLDAMDTWLAQDSQDFVEAYCRGVFRQLHPEVARESRQLLRASFNRLLRWRKSSPRPA